MNAPRSLVRCAPRATVHELRGAGDGDQWCPYSERGAVRWLVLPPASTEVLPGVQWGRAEHSYTPAFWAYLVHQAPDRIGRGQHALGASLREELAACMLGGHGLPAEIGNAAFRLMKEEGLLDGPAPPRVRIERCLRRPLLVGPGRRVRYRFPFTKAKWIHSALTLLDNEVAPTDPLELRDWLLQCCGVGLKTASWVVRNVFPSAEVAVLDIHICRAADHMGLFPASWRLPRDYCLLERRFLSLAHALAIPASDLDATMWIEMRGSRPPD